MSLSQAVILLDHHGARIQHLAPDDARTEKLKEHKHYTRQHASGVRSEHEFFADVCDALEPISETLVTGSHGAQADFRRYVEKHRPALLPHLVGWETVDHPTQGQVAALARAFFAKYDRMAGRAPLQ